MSDPSKLLDTFTQLLAYMGDEGAQDGYVNVNINIRDTPISPNQRTRMVKKMVDFIVNDARLSGIPEDIKVKVVALKDLANNPEYSSQKDELLEYMREYDADEGDMRGGRLSSARRAKRANALRKLHRRTLRKRSHKRRATGRKRY
jgi:hypothetical protein